MTISQWGSEASLKKLLYQLVNSQSLTGTEGEQMFSHLLKEKLLTLRYFQENPEFIELHDAGENRFAVTALYKSERTAKTIVCMSHYDTVHIEEYGDLADVAFQPEKLTNLLKERIDELPEEVQADIKSGDYLFGRGIMDMKMGIALHMQLLEKAASEKWPINLLFVSVPDEEVNSAGMRAVIPEIVEITKRFQLKIELFLNGEPSFSQYEGDKRHHIYSGTIGKIMPAALFYGRETHAGEPLSGMTGQFIASFLTQKMEWNRQFQEIDLGEKTPLPVTLQQIDLKEDYSTQTSHRSAALYNVFLIKKSAREVMDTFREIAEEAAEACNQTYEVICQREEINPIGQVKVMSFQELYHYYCQKLSKQEVDKRLEVILNNETLDVREKSIRIVDQMMIQCQELAPMIIIFFAPPYYPAVNTSEHPLIKEKISYIQQIAKEEFDLEMNQIHYFNGISDLSYVNYTDSDKGWLAYKENTPTWGGIYNIPFTAMQQLQAPVLNVGPFGKDAHKLTERLHMENALVEIPKILERLIKSMFDE